MYDLVLKVIAGLVMIGVLVIVHEAGHFFAAKLFRVGVPVFSIGMGPRLFGIVWRGTDYRVSALPIGGYVQMSGADPFGEQDTEQRVDPAEDFMRKPVWQRLIVMAAGPGVNLALPFFVFTVLLMAGRPDVNARVGTVLPGTTAERIGVHDGDLLRAVNGREVEIWHDVEGAFERYLDRAATTPLRLRLERDGQPVDVVVPPGALQRNVHAEPDFTGLGVAVSRSNTYRGPLVLTARVGVESPDSPAGRAGLRTGDRVTAIDGVAVQTWAELDSALGGERHVLAVERGHEEGNVEQVEVTLALEGAAYHSPAPVFDNRWGLLPLMLFAQSVSEGDPAEIAGVEPGDRFVSVDGLPVLTFDQFIEHVARTVEHGQQPRPLELVLVRAGELQQVTLTPTMRVVSGEAFSRPVIGVTSFRGTYMGVDVSRKYYSLLEAVPRAVEESWSVMTQTAAVLGNVLTFKSPARENVGGPVAIFHMASVVVDQGLFAYAATIGMISVSLGVINLLPVPVLDGGQILFYLIEGLRGRPLSLELRERFQMVGVVALMILMLLVIVNDIHRVLGG